MNQAKRLSVFVSSSKSIYENLAFEEWLFRNHNIGADGNALLLWSNTPSVVIGRHQNPWLEANLPFLPKKGISLVRRHSGGGTVYHDLGNVNISLLTEQKCHQRPHNLRLIADALRQSFNLNVVPNSRDDLYLQPGDRKVSGTAARISLGRAYHHLTLLVSADVELLKKSLTSPWKDIIKTNATRSVSAPAVGFLTQDNASVTCAAAMDVVISAFKKQYKESVTTQVQYGMNDEHFREFLQNERELRSWEWTYGKTPKFSVHLPDNVIHVEKGVISSVEGNRTDIIGCRLPEDVFSL